MPRLLTGPGFAAAAVLTLSVAVAGCAAYIDTRATTREAEWEARFPPLGRLVQVDGRAVHVLEAGRPAGSAPDVVLIHGANGSLRDFTFDLVGRLAADYRVIAVDRPGHGWSESWGEADSDPQAQARILRRALAGYGLSRPIVVGHSYGGAVAMGWALEAEAETGALVLLAGATMPWPGDLGVLYRFLGSPAGGIGRGVIAGVVSERTARGVTSNVFQPDRVPRGYTDHFGPAMAMRRTVTEANTRQVNALKGHVTRMSAQYPRLTLPIEALHGTADTIVGLAIHSQRLADQVGSVNLTVLDGVGHMPHHARPEQTVAAIARAATRAGLR
jgi:pimeloyl-ACP methyl ester carboxylesterase